MAKGRPRAFKDNVDFAEKFLAYIEHCRERNRLANIAGFCAFCWMSRDTFYEQKKYYSDTYKKIMEVLEDEAINCMNSMGIFYLKNKFGYRDKQEVEHQGVSPLVVEVDYGSKQNKGSL